MRSYYLSVVSGRRRGVIAAALRAILSAATIIYYIIHKLRHCLYRIGLFRSIRLPVPVVSVGNLTAGGTGKTPFVEMLARRLARRNLRVAILARGYGRKDDGRDDEEMLAELDLSHIVRLTGGNRAANARRAVEEYRADVIILDDGFQHFRIRRDLDILLVDATNPFAGGRLIPRGLLRERPGCASRSDLIVLTRCDQADPRELGALRDRLDRLSKPLVETSHKPLCVRTLSSKKRQGLDWLRGQRLYAFCGLGNPDAFRRSIESLGAEVAMFREFPDHHPYTPQDLRRLNAEAQEFMVNALITTEKDANKLDPSAFDLPLEVLKVEIEVTRGDELLESSLRALASDATPVGALH